MSITFTITAAGGNKIPQSDIGPGKTVSLEITGIVDTVEPHIAVLTPISTYYEFEWFLIDKPLSSNVSFDDTVGTSSKEIITVNSLDRWGSYRFFVIAKRKGTERKSETNPLKAPEENYVTLSVESLNNKLEKPANYERNWKAKYDKLLDIVESPTKRINVLKVDNNPTGVQFTLPLTDGTNGQMLTTDGSGQLQFVDLDLSNMENNIALDTLTDVNAPAPSEGQVLKWNGSEWIPGASTAIDGLTSDSVSQTLTIQNGYNLLKGDGLASNNIGSLATPFDEIHVNAINGIDLENFLLLPEVLGATGEFLHYSETGPEYKFIEISDVEGLQDELNSKLESYTELNDLSAGVTWANVPDANITSSSVKQHEASLSITTSQISDFATSIPDANQILSGNTRITITDDGDDELTVASKTGDISFVLDGQEKWSISRGTDGTDQNYLLGTNSVTRAFDDSPALSTTTTSLPAGIGVRRAENTSNGAIIEFVDTSADTEIRFKTDSREWTIDETGALYPSSNIQTSGLSFLDLGKVNNVVGQAYISTLSLGLTGSRYSFPTSKGTENEILKVNASGNLIFSDSMNLNSIVADTISANELLQVTSNVLITADTASEVCFKLNAATGQTANVMQISSVSSQGGTATDYFVINSAGQVSIRGLSYPSSDGSAGQVLTTDGSGTLSWATQSGGGATNNISEVNAKVETIDDTTDGSRIDFYTEASTISSNFASGATLPLPVWEISENGHLLPGFNAKFDIGEPENKVRHLYLSNNSLNVGDIKISVTTNSDPMTPAKYLDINYPYDPHEMGTDASITERLLTTKVPSTLSGGTNYTLFYSPDSLNPGFTLQALSIPSGGVDGLTSNFLNTITLDGGYRILPSTNNLQDLGSASNNFRNVYSNEFTGQSINFNGISSLLPPDPDAITNVASTRGKIIISAGYDILPENNNASGSQEVSGHADRSSLGSFEKEFYQVRSQFGYFRTITASFITAYERLTVSSNTIMQGNNLNEITLEIEAANSQAADVLSISGYQSDSQVDPPRYISVDNTGQFSIGDKTHSTTPNYYTFPKTTGTAGQVLSLNANDNKVLEWSTPTSGGGVDGLTSNLTDIITLDSGYKVIPAVDGTQDLGNTDRRFGAVYANEVIGDTAATDNKYTKLSLNADIPGTPSDGLHAAALYSRGSIAMMIDTNNAGADTTNSFIVYEGGEDDSTATERFRVENDGQVRINNSYYLPSTDSTGNSGRVMATNGAGQVSFVDVNTLVSSSSQAYETVYSEALLGVFENAIQYNASGYSLGSGESPLMFMFRNVSGHTLKLKDFTFTCAEMYSSTMTFSFVAFTHAQLLSNTYATMSTEFTVNRSNTDQNTNNQGIGSIEGNLNDTSVSNGSYFGVFMNSYEKTGSFLNERFFINIQATE